MRRKAYLESVFVVGLLAALIAPQAVGAQTRHATPTGLETGDCLQQPCSLEHAVDVAGANDDSVEVGRGSYTLADPLVIGSINVFGDPDYPRPTIVGPTTPADAPGIVVQDGAILSYVNVRSPPGAVIGRDAVRLGFGSRLDQVYASAVEQTAHAIHIGPYGTGSGDPLVTNSIAFHAGAFCNGALDIHDVSAVVRGVTAYGGGVSCKAILVQETSAPSEPVLNARNLIAAGPSTYDIRAQANGELTLQIGDSFVGGPPACDGLVECIDENTATLEQVGGDNFYGASSVPSFVDAANGNLHQAADSPTLNQGAAVGSDLEDIDGDRRSIGGLFSFRDIGADERPGEIGATEPSAVEVAPTSARLTATIDPNGGNTHYFIHYGAPLHFGSCSLFIATYYCIPIGNSLTPIEVSLQLTDLTPGKTYEYRLQAFNSISSYLSPVKTFTTPLPPPQAAPTVAKKCRKGLKPKKRKGKKKKRCVKKKGKKGKR